jgi:hypothetical protein
MTDYLLQLIIPMMRVIVPLISIFGIIGNLLNIAVLTRPTLYRYACS